MKRSLLLQGLFPEKNGKIQYETYSLTWSERVVVLAQSLGLVGGLAYFFYRSIWAVIPLSGVGVFFFREILKKKRESRKQQLKSQFKECISSVSTNLEAGYAVENAFLESREDMKNLYGEDSLIYRELEYLRRGLVINITLEELLQDFAERSDCEEIRQFVQVFATAKRKGGNMTGMIRSFSGLMTQRMDMEEEIHILLAGKAMEQNIMKLMPFLILLYVGSSYGGYFDCLYYNFPGICIMTGCLLVYGLACFLSSKVIQEIYRDLSGSSMEGLQFFLEGKKGVLGLLRKSCKRIYIFLRSHHPKGFFHPAVYQNLKLLCPQEDREKVQESYYVAKFGICFLMWGGTWVFALLYQLQNPMSKTGEPYFLWMLIAGPVLAVGMYFLKDKDLADEVGKYKQVLKMQYPDIVHKLTLYLGAGMSMRNSFVRLSKEYDTILFACRELEAGATEAMAYDRFGKRTGLQEYIRLSTLLTQNLKRGSSTLLSRLEDEAYKSSVERLQMAKKLGEEAGTRLLFPLVMYLAVVMILIMIPAFMGLEI